MVVHAVQQTHLRSNSYVLSVREVVLLVKTGSAFRGIRIHTSLGSVIMSIHTSKKYLCSRERDPSNVLSELFLDKHSPVVPLIIYGLLSM
jgi:hypothetical protein